MTLKTLVDDHAQLGELTARPYRRDLASDASPVAVLAQLPEDDHPGALWGDWFGGGIVIFRRPLRVIEPAQASDGFGYLDEQPGLSEGESKSGLVGGGWLACFGYEPKTTTMAFYDSLLRWQEDSGWRFESLGIDGREHANAAALEYWTAALSAVMPDVRCGIGMRCRIKLIRVCVIMLGPMPPSALTARQSITSTPMQKV